MFKRLFVIIALTFVLGWLCNNLYSSLAEELSGYEIKLNTAARAENSDSPQNSGILQIASKEVASPADRVSENQIHVYKDKILINLVDAQWSTFTDTNSMDPVLDYGANAIQVVPESEDDVNVGDIVSYESEYAEGTIIHRVIEKGADEDGTYFILKGDNNSKADPGKVRFSQIKKVVVAIIY
jgi:hypothetical protein